MKNIILLLLCMCTLTACGYRGLGGSFVGDLPESTATAAIAQDAIDYVLEQYAPGHTSIFLLSPEKDALNAFSAAFEDTLRQKGYEVLQTSTSDAVTLAYTLDSLKESEDESEAWYLQLRISDGQAIARVYDAAGTPVAGRSATTLSRGVVSRATDAAKAKVEGALYD